MLFSRGSSLAITEAGRPGAIAFRGCHTPGMDYDKVLLEGMVFHGYHGTLAAERELGQRFVVDLALYLDLGPAGRSDDLSLTVDYGEAHRRAQRIVEGEPVNLTETVAERIAAALLADHLSVVAVWVKVAKPQVRLGGTVLAGSAVEILRRRE